MKIENIDNLIDEIKYLKGKAKLLDDILIYYDKESMTFEIPDKWAYIDKISDEKLTKMPKSPRHVLNKAIYAMLGYNEAENIVNWDKMDETVK